jgi:hypothetical protein
MMKGRAMRRAGVMGPLREEDAMKTGLALALAGLVLFLPATGPARAEEGAGATPALRLDGFSLAREKVGAIAVAEATLVNEGAAVAGPFDVVLQVLDSYALVKESAPQPVVAIPPGKGAKVKLEIVHCPAFSWFRILLRPKGSQKIALSFVSRSLDKPPVADTSGATVIRRQLGVEAKLVLVDVRATPAAGGGASTVDIKVRNPSLEPVLFPLARLRFLDRAGKAVAARPCLLGLEEIPARADDDYRVSVGDVPAFEKVQADLAWGESLIELPEGLGDTAVRNITVEGYRLVRFTHGDVWVLGRLVNRLRDTVSDVVLSLQLQDKTGKDVRKLQYAFPGPVGTGERQGFEIWSAAVPPFEGFKYGVNFNVVTGDDVKPPATPPVNENPGLLVAERTARRGVAPKDAKEVKGATPVTAGADAKEEKKDAPVAQVELAGWSWVDGDNVRININKTVYSGDVGFLKMRFLNAEALPVAAEGTVIFKVYDRGAPQGTIRRALAPPGWKRDATKLNAATANADVVACDGRVAWVGVVRVPDKGASEITLDVTIEIPKAGSWEWKGLGAPYNAAATPPNKVRK